MWRLSLVPYHRASHNMTVFFNRVSKQEGKRVCVSKTEVTVFCKLIVGATSIPFAVFCLGEVATVGAAPAQREQLHKSVYPGVGVTRNHGQSCLPECKRLFSDV